MLWYLRGLKNGQTSFDPGPLQPQILLCVLSYITEKLDPPSPIPLHPISLEPTHLDFAPSSLHRAPPPTPCPNLYHHHHLSQSCPDSVQPHTWQSTRFPRPWDSLGKNTGVGCHFLLQSYCQIPQSTPMVDQLFLFEHFPFFIFGRTSS